MRMFYTFTGLDWIGGVFAVMVLSRTAASYNSSRRSMLLLLTVMMMMMVMRDRRLGSMRWTCAVLALDLYGVRQSADSAAAAALHRGRRSLGVASGPTAGPRCRRLLAADRVQTLEAAGAVLNGRSQQRPLVAPERLRKVEESVPDCCRIVAGTGSGFTADRHRVGAGDSVFCDGGGVRRLLETVLIEVGGRRRLRRLIEATVVNEAAAVIRLQACDTVLRVHRRRGVTVHR